MFFRPDGVRKQVHPGGFSQTSFFYTAQRNILSWGAAFSNGVVCHSVALNYNTLMTSIISLSLNYSVQSRFEDHVRGGEGDSQGDAQKRWGINFQKMFLKICLCFSELSTCLWKFQDWQGGPPAPPKRGDGDSTGVGFYFIFHENGRKLKPLDKISLFVIFVKNRDKIRKVLMVWHLTSIVKQLFKEVSKWTGPDLWLD